MPARGRHLHHVGFVVASISASAESFRTSLSAQWDGQVFDDPHQKVRVTFLKTGNGDAQFELVEPWQGESPVRRFLEEKGGGLHHVCYEVDDVGKELENVRARREWIVARGKPAVAFGGRLIAWVMTENKLLIELLERCRQPDGNQTGSPR